MNAKHQFQCSRCDSIHDEHYLAEECCQPKVWEFFVCERCDEQHGKRAAAEECCSGEVETPGAYRKRLAEIERAGQLRLVE